MTVQLHLADFLYQSNKLGEARKLNRACTKYFKEPMRDDKALVLCLIQRASIEQASKIYDQASIWFRRARDESIRTLGQNDHLTLDILKRYAMLLETQGDYRNAISTYEQAENWSKQKSKQ
jgi:tetratricopeptide (TPR) repeat protein